ncbi:MAG: hypothetical protein ACR2ML_12630 [Solirubrobacteraceae bacterium]
MEPIVDELEILTRIRCADGTPRELPDGVELTLYDLWSSVQSPVALTPERVRLVCFQVVHSRKMSAIPSATAILDRRCFRRSR